MALRLISILIAASLLGACAGADYPGFVDAAVEATTGTDLQEQAEHRQNNVPSRNDNGAVTAAPANTVSSNIAGPSLATPVAQSDARSLMDVLNFYQNWSALVVSADYRGAAGGSTMAFDNARRDISTQLLNIGFDAGNMAQLTMRPGVDDSDAMPATMDNIRSELRRINRTADEGCLVYFTSHGSPDGLSLGATGLITPDDINNLLERHCGASPTVLIVSACYSGVFARGDMAQENRFIITAARSDRTSFGCGESNQYPFFDACLIENFPQAEDWLDLARSAQGCVQSLESNLNLNPPSAPQIYMGPAVRDVVLTPFITVTHGPPGSGS